MKKHPSLFAGAPARWSVAHSVSFLLATLIAIILTTNVGMQAQTLYGSIVGSISDSSGAMIPQATVTVVQLETNDTRVAQTNGSGGYTLSTVPAGTYKVSISKTGFSAFEATSVNVRVNTTVRVDATLNPGPQTQTITVNANAAELQADRADVSHEVTNQSLEELPQPTRTYEGLIGLMPGVAPPAPAVRTTPCGLW